MRSAVSDGNNIESFDDLFEPFELDEGPPPGGLPPPAPPQPLEADRDEEPVPMVACPSCGTSNPSYNRHCEACGARLSTNQLPVAPPPLIKATPGARALGVLIAVVLVVLLVTVLFNLFGGDDPVEPTTVAVTTSPPETDFVQPVEPTTVEASSTLNATFAADNLLDGDTATEWQDAGLRGDEATLVFRFQQPVSITEIEIVNLPDPTRFKQNWRIKGYKITVDDLGYEISGQLQDVNTPQTIPVASVGTRVLTLTVTTAYASQAVDGGVPFDELALADVRFFGRLAG